MLAVVALDDGPELVHGNKVHQLREDGSTNIHATITLWEKKNDKNLFPKVRSSSNR